jgi:hypothetical protein
MCIAGTARRIDMQRSIIAMAAGLAAAALTSSCSGTIAHDSPTQPTTISAVAASASFSAASPTVVAQQLVGHSGGCPTFAPFSVPINLVVRVNGGVNVFITQIRMRFVDPFRIEAPQVTLPAPMLTTQFGTNLVMARSMRTFPLTFAVGCATDRKGTATLLIDTQDQQGRRESGQVSVTVR